MNDYPIGLRAVTLTLCDLCLDGKGGECHVPGCALYLNRAPDLSIRDRVLRADDDTRYVAITKPMRDVIEYLADIVQTSTAVPLYQIVAAYGAVAPNAKEVGIWECPDGLRAQANCRSNCKAEGHSPCLTCMESFA